MKRADGRDYDDLRKVNITTGYQCFAEGSALIELGKTRVLCSVSVEEKVPPFLRGSGSGWITAEYAMLPRATVTRTARASTLGRPSGRNQEIQRLIGRSLRAIADLNALGERTLIVDCDVLQADGGTRTAAITGAYVLEQGGRRLPGDTPTQQLDPKAPAALVPAANRLVRLTIEVQEDPPVRFQAMVGTAVPAHALVAHLRQWLRLPEGSWSLQVGDKTVLPLQLLEDFSPSEATRIVVRR